MKTRLKRTFKCPGALPVLEVHFHHKHSIVSISWKLAIGSLKSVQVTIFCLSAAAFDIKVPKKIVKFIIVLITIDIKSSLN